MKILAPDYLTRRGPWIAQWLRWNGRHVAARSLADRGFDWRRQNKSPSGTVPAGPRQTAWRKRGWSGPAAGRQRGSEDRSPAAASPGSPAGKLPSVGMRGCPTELGQELRRFLLGSNPPIHLNQRIFFTFLWNWRLIDWLKIFYNALLYLGGVADRTRLRSGLANSA